MILNLLVKESLIIKHHEKIVRLHEIVIRDNEKTVNSIIEFFFILNLFVMIHFQSGVTKIILLRKLKINKFW